MKKHYKISTEFKPTAIELMGLFTQTTWSKKRSISGVQSLLEQTYIYVVIRDEKKIIGYGRAITDGIYRALIDDIVIDENYQKKGLGGQVLSGLLEKLQGVDEIFLNTREHLEIFYKKHGFERVKCLTMKL